VRRRLRQERSAGRASSPDVELAGEECLNVGLTEQAGIAGEAVLEAGEREAVAHRAFIVLAGQQTVQHAGGEGVTRADTVDNAGELDLVRLNLSLRRVDPSRNAMAVAVIDVTRRRSDQLQVWKSAERRLRCLAPPLLAFAGEFASEQQADVAVIAEEKVGFTDQFAQDRVRVRVPALPQLSAVIAVERNLDAV
jgi:hypothetical protein